MGNGNEISYTISSTVKKGNLKIVITDDQNTILHDVPVDCEYQITVSTENGKVYYVKFVGESAELEITINREMG